jgi:hypothetical protein
MPVLVPSNPAISIIPATFLSDLPPSTIGNQFVPLFRSLSADGFGQAHISNGALLAGQLGRSLATTIGWEDNRIPSLANLADTVMTKLPPEALAAIDVMFESLQPTISAALDPLVDAIADAISGIPIVGWIAQVGFMTWKVVQSALSYEWPVHRTGIVAVGYDKENDEYVSNRILDLAGGADWGHIFDPPDGDFRRQASAATSGGPADGMQWGQLEGKSDSPLGAMPGVGDFAGFWQSPKNKPGATKNKKDYDYPKSQWAGQAQIISLGRLLPSSTSLVGQLWANMQLPTPALGRIDFVGLRQRWVDYGKRLIAFAEAHWDDGGAYDMWNRERWATDQVRRSWSWYDVYGPPDSVPANYRHWELDNLISYKIDQAWQNAVRSMQTHAAAYLTDDSPLVRNDAGLKKLLDQMRLELVQGRPDVVLVDPTLIPKPDHGYRDAIITAQQKVKGGLHLAATPLQPPDPDLPALPDGGFYLVGHTPKSTIVRSTLLAAAGAGAASAAAWYFHDDIRRAVQGLQRRLPRRR